MLGIAEHVIFCGRLPDHELGEMLATADVCVNPDEVNPMNDISTMNKVMEYMALGKPIVQFDVREGRVSAGARACTRRPTTPVRWPPASSGSSMTRRRVPEWDSSGCSGHDDAELGPAGSAAPGRL